MPDTEQRLSVREALDLAMRLHRGGQMDEAEALYRRILEVESDSPDALHFLGVLTFQRGDTAEAVRLIRRALAHAPDYPDALSNLGNVLRTQGEVAEAEACYRRALALRPAHTPALLMLGAVLDSQGHRGEAFDQFLQAVDAGSNEPDLLRMVGSAFRYEGRFDDAAGIYRRWLAAHPDDAEPRHLLAACTRQEVPDRAADGYVERLFDRFAESFDERLTHLEYRAPALVADAVARAVGPPQADLVVLDAGCGTGLCGQRLRPYASELVGVDLSAEMLARADGRGLYDRLVQQELTAHLRGYAEALDLIVSADTLVYFGAIGAVLEVAARALKPGGHLVFTLERTDPDAAPTGYSLNATGRYSHALPYVELALRSAGLTLLGADRVVPRKESGSDVDGLLVVAQRLASAA
jgi:predicted TPR repeat methyltransferase